MARRPHAHAAALARREQGVPLEEARAHLERVLTINPFDPNVHQTLARVYERLGQPELAAREREAHRLVNP